MRSNKKRHLEELYFICNITPNIENSMLKSITISITVVLFTTCMMNAQTRYSCSCESQMGQNFGAENLNTCFHLFDVTDSLIFPKQILEESHASAKLINPLYRFSKLLLTNYIFTDFLMTMNHERFGHGYRVIETGGEINRIVYNPAPPFGNNGFSYISWNGPAKSTPQQNILIIMGGSEANLVLSDVMRKNILLEGHFNYNYALAYLYGSNDMPGYTAFVTSNGSDPNVYRRQVNEFYFDTESLTRKKMRLYSFFAIATDPMNFYAFKSVFYDYLIKGKSGSKTPMLRINELFSYMPRFRFEYTPYGPELVYQNFVKINDKLIQLSYSHADGSLGSSWRFDAEAWNLKVSEKWSFNFSGQVWNQPIIDFYMGDELTRSNGLGALVFVTSYYDIISNGKLLGLTLQAGYKSTGYALGE